MKKHQTTVPQVLKIPSSYLFTFWPLRRVINDRPLDMIIKDSSELWAVLPPPLASLSHQLQKVAEINRVLVGPTSGEGVLRGMLTSATSGAVHNRQGSWHMGVSNVLQLPTHRASKGAVDRVKVNRRPGCNKAPKEGPRGMRKERMLM